MQKSMDANSKSLNEHLKCSSHFK